MTLVTSKIALTVKAQELYTVAKLFITNKLKEFRESKGWTQEQLADWLSLSMDTKVSLSLVQKWEYGERSVNPDIAVELIGLLKISSEQLFERR